MRFLRWLCLLLVLGLPTSSFAADIQVACEPGLRVYLDGKLAGVSSAKEDGLFLSDVRDGTHILRVEKDGFAAQSFEIAVAGAPIEVKVGAFTAAPAPSKKREAASAEVKQATGTLKITSAPQNCLVELEGKAENKNTPLLVVENLAAGEHRITFSRAGYEPISATVKVQPGAEVNVRGDLIAGKVETTHEGQGSLRVLSNPEHCAVQILGMTREKTRARLNMTHLPAGEHRLVLSWKGGKIATSVTITRDMRTIVTVNFLDQVKPLQISYEPE